MVGREYVQTKVVSRSDLDSVKQHLGKWPRVFVSRGNRPALNLFRSLKLPGYVKGYFWDWECYVSLTNAKYRQKSSSWPHTATCVPNKCKTHQQRERTPPLFFLGRHGLTPESYRQEQPVIQWITLWLCQVGLTNNLWRVNLLNTRHCCVFPRPSAKTQRYESTPAVCIHLWLAFPKIWISMQNGNINISKTMF